MTELHLPTAQSRALPDLGTTEREGRCVTLVALRMAHRATQRTSCDGPGRPNMELLLSAEALRAPLVTPLVCEAGGCGSRIPRR